MNKKKDPFKLEDALVAHATQRIASTIVNSLTKRALEYVEEMPAPFEIRLLVLQRVADIFFANVSVAVALEREFSEEEAALLFKNGERFAKNLYDERSGKMDEPVDDPMAEIKRILDEAGKRGGRS